MIKNALGKIWDSEKSLYVIIGFLCIGIFGSIYGIKIINPTYVDWLLSDGGDLSQHYLGWKAYRESSWHFPIGMVDTLAYPYHTSIIFTDSIPIFAVLFKLLSPVLPSNFQYFGLWGIVCFVFQGVLSARIIKNYTTYRSVIIVSSIFFAYTPVMIFRMYYHTALAGQWIILLGLELVFSYEKYKDSKKIYFLINLLGVLSVSIHFYFVLMCGIILIGVCLADVIINKHIKRHIYYLSVYILSALITMGALGGFSSAGMKGISGGLGNYSFNINGFVNSQGWSKIFQSLPLYDNGQHEGFAYLGAGSIFLFIVSVVVCIVKDNIKEKFRKYQMVILALFIVSIISIMVALSPVITFGDHIILDMPLPGVIIDLWSVFRSTGRFAWDVVYIIMLFSIICLISVVNQKIFLIIVSFSLTLQIYDLKEQLWERHIHYSEVVEYNSCLTDSNFWNKIAQNKDIKHFVYYSPATSDKAFMYSLTDWALNHDKTVNDFYFARSNVNAFVKSRGQALEQLSEDNVFIFNEKDKSVCLKYNLHYYEINGVIVGYVNEIDGFNEMSLERVWNFGENQYLRNGNDTEEGRVLYPNGLSYGPYWSVPSGNYVITITGDDIPEKMDISIYSNKSGSHHDYEIVSRSNTAITMSIALTEDVTDLEIAIQNNTGKDILLKGIEMQGAE